MNQDNRDEPGKTSPDEAGSGNRPRDLEYPRLRPVEAIPAQQDMVCLRDTQGFSDKLLLIPRQLLFVLSLFDGNHGIVDIQAAYTRRFGDLLFSDRLRSIIDQLDQALFLESGRFHRMYARAVEEYRESPVRRASHAGTAYEENPEELTTHLNALFDACGESENTAEHHRIAGLIAPHIDIARGGSCFARTYRVLQKEMGPLVETDGWTFVILGIAHAPTARRFVLTAKDFETPLGNLPVDRDFLEQLTRGCSTDFFQDELMHRGEHSVEFQALFLRYLFPAKNVRIVPVLCSSRESDYRGPPPGEDPEFKEFCESLKDTARLRDTCCLVAGVDLSHLGKRFGQDVQVNDQFLRWAREQDMRMIDTILRGDASGFMQYIRNEQDRRNVCGVPALHTMLSVLSVNRSRLVMYDQAVDREADSVVTFMGGVLY